MKKTVLFSLLVLFIIISFVSLLFLEKPKTNGNPASKTIVQNVQNNSLSYSGRVGTDALSLLKEKASVEMDTSGMVVSINGRKAETTKREYWAFYINGSMSQVGPKAYITTAHDAIVWKIATY